MLVENGQVLIVQCGRIKPVKCSARCHNVHELSGGLSPLTAIQHPIPCFAGVGGLLVAIGGIGFTPSASSGRMLPLQLRVLRSVRKDGVAAVLSGGLDGKSTRAGHIRARTQTVRKLQSPPYLT